MTTLSAQQLTGQAEDHLVKLDDGHRLREEVAQAFDALRVEAAKAGFTLAIASSFRSFERQLHIWNGKACGDRPVHDADGCAVNMSELDMSSRRHAILRFSALPGASRHHWGTDLDVYDAAAVSSDYQVQLTPQEVEPGGVFDALHLWLDEKIATGDSHGCFRPYARDNGGVVPERWHLSYGPLASACARQLTPELLRQWWRRHSKPAPLLFEDSGAEDLESVFEQYVRVSEATG